ncbi:MAG: ABC transporter permease [Solirubrobacterales bacterium]|jgi:putative ABC transport system permease protein
MREIFTRLREDLGAGASQAVRTTRSSPGYTIAVLLTVALCIGANAAVFAVWNALLLRPLPYPDPERLFVLQATRPGPTGTPETYVASPLDFVRWKNDSRGFEEIGALWPRDVGLLASGEPETVPAAALSASMFPLLGASPMLGRVFTAAEDRADSRLVVLAHGLWQRRFGSDPAVVGRTVRLDGEAFTVIGVMGPGFQPLFYRSELWVPLGIDEGHMPRPGARYLLTAGRLRGGVSAEQGKAELAALSHRLEEQFPETHRGWGSTIEPLRDNLFGDRRPALRLLLGGAAFLLLIGCANLANLMLARAVARRGETALRLALGASRERILRQELVASLLLGLAGSGLGLALARAALKPLLLLDPETARVVGAGAFDLRLLAFTFGATVLTTVAFGLLPALRQSGSDAGEALRGEGPRVAGHRRDRRVRHVLLAAQIGVTLVLLVGSGLLLRALGGLANRDPGFRPGGVLVAQMVLPTSRYTEAPRRVAFVDELLQRTRALPSVQAASTTMTRFLRRNESMQATFVIEGRPVVAGEDLGTHFRRISDDYLRTMGTRLVAGREFNPGDRADTLPVVMVSESFARRHFPGEDALGRRLARRTADGPRWLTVVGVAADVMDSGLAEATGPTMYLPYAQNSVAGVTFAPLTLVIRTAGDPRLLAPAVRAAIAAIDRDLPVESMTPLRHLLSESLGPQRFRTILLSVFGALGLALAAIGIYGVTAYTVAQRTRELGVRLALGAQGRDVVVLVLRSALTTVATGLSLGLVASLLAGRAIRGLLYGIPPSDPATLGLVAGGLGAIAIAAAYLPARRVVRIDPMLTLRAD